MIRTKNNWLTSLAITLGCVIPGAISAGCASDQAASEDISESAATLGVEVASCSQSGSSGYNASSNLTLTMGSVTNLVFGVVNGYVTVNGYACVKSTGAKLKPSDIKKITITGTSGDDKVVIDTLSGALGSTILAATGGIVIDMAGGTGDVFSIRGSSNADKWSSGMSGGDLYFEISGDTTADVRVQNDEVVNVSLSGGNDIFTEQGGTFTATHLAGVAVTSLTAVTLDTAINGGDGDDTLTGGDGDDAISGGAGNDIFKSAVLDGDDTIAGGAGTDKMDYTGRTNDLTVVMDGSTDSGEGSEKDHVGSDVEDMIGGGGNDTLTGNTVSNHIQGGNGDDTISGGVNAGACTSDIDVLDGEGGNDVFDEGSAADCADTVNGGAGTDRIDYQGRSADLGISLDGVANDGDSAVTEKDNIKNDVEIVISGSGNDTIVGSANADELHGGPGNDTIGGGAGNDVLTGDSGNDILNGEAGDDTFDESDVDAEYASGTENKGDDDDVMNGGTHDTLGIDTVSYALRTADVIASTCMDSTKLTGSATASLTGTCADDDGESGEHDKIVNVTHIIGGDGDDTLTGHTADDTLEGGDGDDTLKGGAGNDILFGDDGDDTLEGSSGDDYLDGGAATSADSFDGDDAATTTPGDGDVCITKAGDTITRCEL